MLNTGKSDLRTSKPIVEEVDRKERNRSRQKNPVNRVFGRNLSSRKGKGLLVDGMLALRQRCTVGAL